MKRTDGPFLIYELLPGRLYQRGRLHELPIATVVAGLKHYSITHTVALAPNRPDHRLPIFVEHLFEPIPDSRLPADRAHHLQTLAAGYAEMISEEGAVVLTMCNAGRNRSGLLSALIVRELLGLPGSAAVALVREHRPNALANPHFVEFLEGLE